MNFEITSELLKRTVTLSAKLSCEAEHLLAEIYRKGLEVMEGTEQQKSVKKVPLDRALFIQENWLTMSDVDIANALNLSVSTIKHYRSTLGLSHTGKQEALTKEDVEKLTRLDEREKALILSKPEDSHQVLSRTLRKPAPVIKAYRLELAAKHINDHVGEELDAVAAKRFGLKASDYFKLRLRLGFKNIKGPTTSSTRKVDLAVLGTPEEIRYHLSEGGMNITDIMRAKKLPVTRERVRQIIAEYGLTGKVSQRKPLWYAHRLVGVDRTELARNLTNKEWVASKLTETGGLNALAGRIGVTRERLNAYLRENSGLEISIQKNNGRMVELKCTYCNASIWRRKNLIESEKKKYPNRKTCFCNKVCQGKWLADHRSSPGQGTPHVS